MSAELALDLVEPASSRPTAPVWLVITCRGDFERLVRSVSRRAEALDLPQPAGPPTPEQADALAAACREYGIELVGPPLA